MTLQQALCLLGCIALLTCCRPLPVHGSRCLSAHNVSAARRVAVVSSTDRDGSINPFGPAIDRYLADYLESSDGYWWAVRLYGEFGGSPALRRGHAQFSRVRTLSKLPEGDSARASAAERLGVDLLVKPIVRMRMVVNISPPTPGERWRLVSYELTADGQLVLYSNRGARLGSCPFRYPFADAMDTAPQLDLIHAHRVTPDAFQLVVETPGAAELDPPITDGGIRPANVAASDLLAVLGVLPPRKVVFAVTDGSSGPGFPFPMGNRWSLPTPGHDDPRVSRVPPEVREHKWDSLEWLIGAQEQCIPGLALRMGLVLTGYEHRYPHGDPHPIPDE